MRDEAPIECVEDGHNGEECDNVDLYLGSRNEIAGNLSVRSRIGEKGLADIEGVDVRQCRATSSSVESDERNLQYGIKNHPVPEHKAVILMQFSSLKVSEAATDLLWLPLIWHEPGCEYIGNFH